MRENEELVKFEPFSTIKTQTLKINVLEDIIKNMQKSHGNGPNEKGEMIEEFD